MSRVFKIIFFFVLSYIFLVLAIPSISNSKAKMVSSSKYPSKSVKCLA